MADSTLSIKQLSSAVSGAVQTALDRHKLKSTNQFIINPGTLAGPLLDHATDLKVAQQIAEEVTKQVQTGLAQGGHAASAIAARPLQSGVLITPKYILCGFFPYEVPQINVERF